MGNRRPSVLSRDFGWKTDGCGSLGGILKGTITPAWNYCVLLPKRLEGEWLQCGCSAAFEHPNNTSVLLLEVGTGAQFLNHSLTNTVKPH